MVSGWLQPLNLVHRRLFLSTRYFELVLKVMFGCISRKFDIFQLVAFTRRVHLFGEVQSTVYF